MGSDLAGARVLVMGLGAHGGGAASARFCAEAGAEVTVTDLRTETDLASSVERLSGLPIRFVLGRHDPEDFRRADIVVKNPAVPRGVPLLEGVHRIETDISLFLAEYAGPVLAITGTKGKSTTASALHHVIAAQHPHARLGGNITVSPLTFLRELRGNEPVVLELSSFQLGDLLLTRIGEDGTLPPFPVCGITNLLPDHQDYYGSMETYAADKALIFSGQRQSGFCLLSSDDPWSRGFAPPDPERVIRISSRAGDATEAGGRAWIDAGRAVLELPAGGERRTLLDRTPRVPGRHMLVNLLFAGVGAYLFGVPAATIRERLADFPGVPHRLEHVAAADGVRYVNDSAATVAEAARAAVESFSEPVHLIAGGSDKGVPLDDFVAIASRAASLHLLEGTGTRRIIELLDGANLPYAGPYSSLEEALVACRTLAAAGEIVLLSPGCASFGMFRNEFDRGDQFRSLVRRLTGVVE